jgi:hypothetical protein
MNLNLCIESWIDHIDILTLRGSSYGAHAINGFKEGKKTKPAYEWLDLHCKNKNTGFELSINNKEITLIDLFMETNCDPELVSLKAFQFFKRCTQHKKLLSLDLNELKDETDEFILPKIIEKLDIVKNNFNDLLDDVDETAASSSQQVISSTLPTYMADINNNFLLDEIRSMRDTMNNKFESMDSKIANLTLNSGYENKTLNQLINHLSFTNHQKSNKPRKRKNNQKNLFFLDLNWFFS